MLTVGNVHKMCLRNVEYELLEQAGIKRTRFFQMKFCCYYHYYITITTITLQG